MKTDHACQRLPILQLTSSTRHPVSVIYILRTIPHALSLDGKLYSKVFGLEGSSLRGCGLRATPGAVNIVTAPRLPLPPRLLGRHPGLVSADFHIRGRRTHSPCAGQTSSQTGGNGALLSRAAVRPIRPQWRDRRLPPGRRGGRVAWHRTRRFRPEPSRGRHCWLRPGPGPAQADERSTTARPGWRCSPATYPGPEHALRRALGSVLGEHHDAQLAYNTLVTSSGNARRPGPRRHHAH